MSYIWNRFQGRNTHRDINSQGSDFKNARSPFVTATEGAPTADVNKVMLPLFGVFDDDSPNTHPLSGGVIAAGALYLLNNDGDMAFVATTVVDEDVDLALKTALTQSTAWSSFDTADGFVAPLSEDYQQARDTAPASTFAALPNIDDDSTHILVEDAEPDTAQRSVTSSAATPSPDADVDFAFPLDDAETDIATAASFISTATQETNDDQAFAFPIEDADTNITIQASRVVFTSQPESNDEDLPFTVDDADTISTTAPRGAHAPVLEIVDEDFAFPINDDDGNRNVVARAATLSTAGDDDDASEAAPILADDETTSAGTAPRVLGVYTPTTPDEDVPSSQPPPPPAQEEGQPQRKRTGGGGWPESNLYDPIEGDPNHPYYDVEAAEENAAQADLADLAAWAQLVVNILADATTTEIAELETSVVVDSISAATEIVAATGGNDVGQLNTAATVPTIGDSVDVSDVDTDVTVSDPTED